MNINLYNADCLDVLSNLSENSVDLVLCDLPYGTTAKKWDIIIPMNDYVEIKNKKIEKDDYFLRAYKENLSFSEANAYFEKNKKPGLWTLYEKVLKPDGIVILFGQEPFSTYLRKSNIEDYKYDIYWEKERLTNIQQVKKRVGKTIETISIFYKTPTTYNPQMVEYTGKKRRNTVKDGSLGGLVDKKSKKVKPYEDKGVRYPTQVWKYARDFLKEEHFATQKPLLLLKDLILTYSNEGETVLDNTMGWGSTGQAAILTNRNFIGIEKNPEHFKKAEERIYSFLERSK